MKSFRTFECVCEKQFSDDNAPPRPSPHRPRLCRGSTSLFGILRHPIYPSLIGSDLEVNRLWLGHCECYYVCWLCHTNHGLNRRQHTFPGHIGHPSQPKLHKLPCLMKSLGSVFRKEHVIIFGLLFPSASLLNQT